MRAIPCGAVSVRTALLAAAPMVPAAGKGIDDRPTWIAPRYRKMARGFGEDCLSVQGSSGWVFRSIARGREFRSRRGFFRLEGTASRSATRRWHAGGGWLDIAFRRRSPKCNDLESPDCATDYYWHCAWQRRAISAWVIGPPSHERASEGM